jgi:hypothetical protein
MSDQTLHGVRLVTYVEHVVHSVKAKENDDVSEEIELFNDGQELALNSFDSMWNGR